MNTGRIWKSSGVYYFSIHYDVRSHGDCAVTLKQCYDWFEAVGAFEDPYQITININDEPIVVTNDDEWVNAFLIVDRNVFDSK